MLRGSRDMRDALTQLVAVSRPLAVTADHGHAPADPCKLTITVEADLADLDAFVESVLAHANRDCLDDTCVCRQRIANISVAAFARAWDADIDYAFGGGHPS